MKFRFFWLDSGGENSLWWFYFIRFIHFLLVSLNFRNTHTLAHTRTYTYLGLFIKEPQPFTVLPSLKSCYWEQHVACIHRAGILFYPPSPFRPGLATLSIQFFFVCFLAWALCSGHKVGEDHTGRVWFTVFSVPTMQFRLAWNLCMSEDDLELLINPPAPLTCWDYRRVTTHLASFFCLRLAHQGVWAKVKAWTSESDCNSLSLWRGGKRHSHIPCPQGHSYHHHFKLSATLDFLLSDPLLYF